MTFPHNHKTVLLLDRTPFFMKSSEQTIDFDVINKVRTPGIIPMAPLSKSLWTCNVEACLEFTRIVYDIFPAQKLIRIVIGDTSSVQLNNWSAAEQNLPFLMKALAETPAHTATAGAQLGSDVTLLNGLADAVSALCHPTPLQQRHLETGDGDLRNRGRVIVLTHLHSESHMTSLEKKVDAIINETNSMARDRPEMLALDECEISFVHVIPVGQTPALTPRAHRQVSAQLGSELHTSESGHYISSKLIELCTIHYHMCSTTVTGIPMKEEQNASSSANYDVELLHPTEAHDELFISGCSEELIIPSKEGLYTSTVTLKWCTPKTNIVELQQCTGAYRFTPVDINSRPSSCLTNFLLNGRSVMLEQPRKHGSRVVSHMLTSHGGELFIHVLATARCLVEDPPSISEGAGGRLTDYRIKEFAELMKENRLAPVSGDVTQDPSLLEKALSQLERITRMWPLTLGETLLFNGSHADPLPSLIVRPRLSEEEVVECEKAIYHVVNMEARNVPLPSQPAAKTKGPKRAGQYKQLWAELERLVRAHAQSSSRHNAVLECLLNCKKPDEEAAGAGAGEVVKAELSSQDSGSGEEKPSAKLLDVSLKEYDRYQNMTEREKQEFNRVDIKSPDSPPPTKRIKTESIFPKGKGPMNLLALWSTNTAAYQNSRCNEFSGRIEFGNKAQLYKKLLEENASEQQTNGVKTEKMKVK